LHQEDVTVTARFPPWLVLGAALLLVRPVAGQEPPPLGVARGRAVTPPRPVPTNQQIADTIAAHLRQSGQLRRYTVDITFQDGTADVSGTVADQTQREEALRIVLGVPGVERVLDHLTLAPAAGLRQVQATQPAAQGADAPRSAVPTTSEPPLSSGPALQEQDPPPPVPLPQEPAPLPRKTAEAGARNGAPNEPVPIYSAPRPQVYDLNPPKMPPYAWPTYAPYNNVSRVAYPTLYPYNAWPFIGPPYPFPKVPLGWRSVKLEWKDGHWWYGKCANGHDWWRLRYW
jgi:hypothetical protein